MAREQGTVFIIPDCIFTLYLGLKNKPSTEEAPQHEYVLSWRINLYALPEQTFFFSAWLN